MDPTDIGLFAMADRRMRWDDERQRVISSNIANADTPGWRAEDVVPFSSMLDRASADGQMAMTEPGHIAGTLGGLAGMVEPMATSESAPDGNDVSLEDQIVAMASTATQHDMVTSLYEKYLTMFRTALDR